MFNLKLYTEEQEGELNLSMKLNEKPCYFNIEKEGDQVTLSEVSSISDYKMENPKERASKIIKT